MEDIEKVLKILPDVSEMLYQMYKDETDKESISVRYDQYLAVDDAIELLKERQPYKVKNIKNVSGWIIGECPSCGSSLHKEFSPNFCGNCGDAIDWSKDGEQK